MSKQNIKLSELTENLFFKNYQKLINMKTKTNSEKIIRHKEMSKVLKKIKYPGFSRDIISFGIVKDIKIKDDSEVLLFLSFKSNNSNLNEMMVCYL